MRCSNIQIGPVFRCLTMLLVLVLTGCGSEVLVTPSPLPSTSKAVDKVTNSPLALGGGSFVVDTAAPKTTSTAQLKSSPAVSTALTTLTTVAITTTPTQITPFPQATIIEAAGSTLPPPPGLTATLTITTSVTPDSRKMTEESSPCLQGQIKGNLNSKIYHSPGQRDYAKTKNNVQCFDTSGKAQKAGFRAALR